jgi:hypothetical protein
MKGIHMRRWRQLGAMGAVVFASILATASNANATMTGPCSATVNGEDVATRSASSPGDAIDVGDADEVVVQARSSSAIGTYRIQLEYAGIRWTVAKGESSDNTWSRSVKVDDYARYGAGIYRVHGVSDGGSSCDGAVLVDVGGSPLTTPVGLAASAFVLLGVANAALNVRSGRKAVGS